MNCEKSKESVYTHVEELPGFGVGNQSLIIGEIQVSKGEMVDTSRHVHLFNYVRKGVSGGGFRSFPLFHSIVAMRTLYLTTITFHKTH